MVSLWLKSSPLFGHFSPASFNCRIASPTPGVLLAAIFAPAITPPAIAPCLAPCTAPCKALPSTSWPFIAAEIPAPVAPPAAPDSAPRPTPVAMVEPMRPAAVFAPRLFKPLVIALPPLNRLPPVFASCLLSPLFKPPVTKPLAAPAIAFCAALSPLKFSNPFCSSSSARPSTPPWTALSATPAVGSSTSVIVDRVLMAEPANFPWSWLIFFET